MEWLEPHQRVGLAICSPHRKIQLPNGEWILDTITVDWHRSRTALAWPTNIVQMEWFCDGMEIGVARDSVARRSLEHHPRPGFLFFLDDDVLPDVDALIKLYAHAQWRPDCDIFAGVYTCKGGHPADPLIYAGDGAGGFWDWTVGDILTSETHGITSVHMGLTLIRVSLFQRMLDAGIVDDENPFFKTNDGERSKLNGCVRSKQGTEDIHFCNLARKVGAKILVDTSCLAGHIDKRSGITYGLHPDCPPVKRAHWLNGKDRESDDCRCVAAFPNGQPAPEGYVLLRKDRSSSEQWHAHFPRVAKKDCPECGGTGKLPPPKICLEIGAGGFRQQWPGYKTYTLDIRPDAKPDYCQDVRQLNFPADHFDMLASSHFMEHLGRWDQEQVWREMFRVVKPGGCVEHVIPSLDWAARKVAENEVDEHVMNVFYGMQEEHRYERQFNTHYFGYTKAIARALAEQAGFVDIEITDWQDNPVLAYEMIVKAKKPGGEEVPPLNGHAEEPALKIDYGACTRPTEKSAEVVNE